MSSEPVGAPQAAQNPPGHTSTHPDPTDAPQGTPKPSDDVIRAQQWAHLRKYYVNGEQA